MYVLWSIYCSQNNIDDEHRIVLESTSEDVDCKQDYINVTYIDVRFLKNTDVRSL